MHVPYRVIIGLVFRLGLRVFIGSFELNISPIAPCSRNVLRISEADQTQNGKYMGVEASYSIRDMHEKTLHRAMPHSFSI